LIAIALAVLLAQAPVDQIPINAPYVISPGEVVGAMLKLAAVKKTDVVYDLGCGDGRIVIHAAQRYGARGVGVDINPQRVAEARANAKKAGVEHLVRFEQKDIFDTDVREATVVALYLLPELNLKLRPKLQKELKPGARVVSHQFHMGDWKPDKELALGPSRIFLWTLPGD
jgi:SAM-dependent methyltransferase